MAYSFNVSEHDEGRRLDKIIRRIWPDLPLGGLMRALRKGLVRVDGKRVSCSTRVTAGQLVQVPFEAPSAPPARKASAIEGELDTIFGDGNILVLNKPWGLLTQPAARRDDSLIGRVWSLTGVGPTGFRPTPVHRLDRNTSGLVVVALNGVSLRILQDAFRDRRVSKIYWAIVVGEVPPSGTIDAPILKDGAKNMVEVSEDGRPARTRFNRLACDTKLSLVELELLTGRPHQARIHMAHIGHPILGDPKYGNGRINARWEPFGVSRPMLHARALRFRELPEPLDYLSGKTFIAPLADDMRQLKRIWD